MNKIEKLTEAQIAKFPEYIDKYIKIGLSTEPADFNKSTNAALKAYAWCNFDSPMIVLHMSSPYGATLGGALAFILLRELKQKTTSQVWSQVWSQVGSQVRSQVRAAAYNNRGGELWASWVAYVSFIRDECGWDGDTLNKFKIDEDLVSSCGGVWWHENVLAISDRPLEINRDEEGRLHAENKPSMTYRDGWKLYNWHGVSVPENWIMDKESLTAAEVLATENTEQRAAGAEIVGWAKIEKELGAKIINDSGDKDIGYLIEMTLPGLSEPGRFLKAWCPRNGFIYEGVPKVSEIDNLPIDTALAAQAWRIGDAQSEYSHPIDRT